MELWNFGRGRHLYSAGQPSRWASAHILVTYIFCDYFSPFLIFVFSVLAVGSHILDTLPMLLSGRLPAALEFQVSLKQEDCASLARSDSRQDLHRAVSASLRSPRDWRPPRCPHTTWLRGIDVDVQSANIGIHSAWRKVNDRVLWLSGDISSTRQHSIRAHH